MKIEDTKYTGGNLEKGNDFFITDKYNKRYHFKITSVSIGSQMLLYDATQVIKEGSNDEPYIFKTMTDVDEDPEYAKYLLKAKIKKGIDKRHLDFALGKRSIKQKENDDLFGRVECSNDLLSSAFDTYFVVDGKRITVEELVQMLEPYTGFNFKFTIYDPYDDLPE